MYLQKNVPQKGRDSRDNARLKDAQNGRGAKITTAKDGKTALPSNKNVTHHRERVQDFKVTLYTSKQ